MRAHLNRIRAGERKAKNGFTCGPPFRDMQGSQQVAPWEARRRKGYHECQIFTFVFPLYSSSVTETNQQESSRPITYWIGEGAGWLLRHVVSGLAATGLTPNMFTFFGLAVNSWAAALFAYGRFRQAAAVLFFAGFLDMADGQVARRVGRVTAFGAFPRFHARPLFGPRAVHGPRRLLHAGRPALLHDACRGGHGEFLHGELFASARGIADSVLQSGLHGAARSGWCC